MFLLAFKQLFTVVFDSWFIDEINGLGCVVFIYGFLVVGEVIRYKLFDKRMHFHSFFFIYYNQPD